MLTYKKLEQHVGHEIECAFVPAAYSIFLTCLTCNEQLYSVHKHDTDPVIWQLTILHKYGTDVYAFQDEQTAREQLYKYVENNWTREFPNEYISGEHEDAIDDYFADNERESYILTEQPILCEVEE